MIGRIPSTYATPERIDPALVEVWPTIERGKIWKGEFVNRKRSGEAYWSKSMIAPITDETVEITHYVAISEDFTARKELEVTLRRQAQTLTDANAALDHARRAAVSLMQDAHAERRSAEAASAALALSQQAVVEQRAQLQFILDSAPHGVLIASGGEVRYVNAALSQLFGLGVGDPLRHAGLEELFDGRREVGATPHVAQLRAIAANGEGRDLMVSMSGLVFEGEACLLAWIVDISHLMRVERELNHVSDRLRLAARAARLGVWDWDLRTDRLVWDEAMLGLYGLSPEAFCGCYVAWQTHIHRDDQARVDAAVIRAARDELEFALEFRGLHTDGTIRTIRANALVERDADGEPVAMVGTSWDVT